MTDDLLTIICGDALTELGKLPDESVQCCVTSPPYWGLRNYNCEGQLGLEKTPEEYVTKLVEVFREVRRVLRKEGTLWLNLGDSYIGGGIGFREEDSSKQATNYGSLLIAPTRGVAGFKPKDLVGIPWMVAFALRADGWWMRSEIIWHKPNPMPESVTDRPTKSHEYLFLLTKSSKYYYDAEAIKEPCRDSSLQRLGQDVENQLCSERVPFKTNGPMKAVKFGGNNRCPDTRLQSDKDWIPKACGQNSRMFQDRDPNHSSERKVRPHGVVRDRLLDYDSKEAKLRPNGNRGEYENETDLPEPSIMANKKSVWTVPTQPFKEAHFATYPPDLIKPCILAGSGPRDVVLDPFAGIGTTGMVALELGRKAILIELNSQYCDLIRQRCDVTPGLALA